MLEGGIEKLFSKNLFEQHLSFQESSLRILKPGLVLKMYNFILELSGNDYQDSGTATGGNETAAAGGNETEAGGKFFD